MDVEKMMQFILDQQAQSEARHAAWKAEFDAGIEELKKRQDATERLINAFARAGQAQIELHTARLDGLDKRLETQERQFQTFLGRFDDFLRGRRNGDTN
jgi:vacuolar-type H+-ATPase subunit E/Vma4